MAGSHISTDDCLRNEHLPVTNVEVPLQGPASRINHASERTTLDVLQSPVRRDLSPGTNDATLETLAPAGVIRSWRGALILSITCIAQFMDDYFLTTIDMALPPIQREWNVEGGNLQWCVSAYVLTFGGLLLLSGVLADRYGRKMIFTIGVANLTIWALACGFASSFIQLAIFRAFQGIGAAMTIPAALGIITNYFSDKDRTFALTIFAGAGSCGFTIGLIAAGFLTSAFNWRYTFYVPVSITGTITILSWIVLPADERRKNAPEHLDYLGSAVSTAGLILFTFVLSGGGVFGWGKAFIIALLVISIALICVFVWLQTKVSNPIMPLYIWKLPNFAASWLGVFAIFGSYQATLYYTVLMAQEVSNLSPRETAIRFLPMGMAGGIVCLGMAPLIERFNTKLLLLSGVIMCVIAPLPAALFSEGPHSFWRYVLPTSILCVCGPSVVFCTITVVLMASVTPDMQSLCGGMVNTAFQLGGGVGLAVVSSIVQSTQTNKGRSLTKQYTTGMWICMALAGLATAIIVLGVRSKSSIR